MTSNALNEMVSLEGCTDCEHHYVRFGTVMCLALRTSKPASYMRHEASDCGPTKKLFDLRQQYAEYQ